MLGMQWSKDQRAPSWASVVSIIEDSRQFEVWHTMPPISQEGYGSGDVVWGFHSGWSYNASTQWSPTRVRYWDRLIARNRIDEIDDADIGAWGRSSYLDPTTNAPKVDSRLSIPNNYPTGRECATGYWLIDEFGTGSDQFINHSASDDPLINSFTQDLVEGRYITHLNFKAYDFLGVDSYDVATGGTAWPTNDARYISINPYYAGTGRSTSLFIQFGPPASADDWVLYK